MREYLFRGKRVEDGEWVEGSVIQSTESTCIARSDMSDENQWAFTYEVDPETVGQYTGVDDAECHKIFEGDTIRIRKTGVTFLYKIEFNNGSFILRNTKTGLEGYSLRRVTELITEGLLINNIYVVREELLNQ